MAQRVHQSNKVILAQWVFGSTLAILKRWHGWAGLSNDGFWQPKVSWNDVGVAVWCAVYFCLCFQPKVPKWLYNQGDAVAAVVSKMNGMWPGKVQGGKKEWAMWHYSILYCWNAYVCACSILLLWKALGNSSVKASFQHMWCANSLFCNGQLWLCCVDIE